MTLWPSFNSVLVSILGIMLSVHLFSPKLVGIPIILLAIAIVVGYVKKEISFHFSRHLMFFSLLYMAYLLGCIWTLDSAQALKYVENKAVFLLFPLLFSCKVNKFNLKILNYVICALIALVLLTCLVSSYQHFDSNLTTLQNISSSNFSRIHHPSYLAAMIMVIALFPLSSLSKATPKIEKYGIGLASIFGLIIVILCQSLAGYLALIALILGYIIFVIFPKYVTSIKNFLIVSALTSLVIFLIVKNDKIWNDMQSAKSFATEYVNDPVKFVQHYPDYKEGNQTRLIMWTVAFSVFTEHPFGLGTGNIDTYFEKKLIQFNQKSMIEYHYNPHNQYLQVACEIGVLGLILFLAIIYSGFRAAYKARNFVLFGSMLVLTLNSLFESIFQLQSGIVFFTLISSICILNISSNFNLKPVNQ